MCHRALEADKFRARPKDRTCSVTRIFKVTILSTQKNETKSTHGHRMASYVFVKERLDLVSLTIGLDLEKDMEMQRNVTHWPSKPAL